MMFVCHSGFVILHRAGHLSMQMNGQTALVVGGSSGLGAACVRELLAAGARVAIADLNEPPVSWRNGEPQTRTLFSRTDVTSTEDVNAILDEICARFHSLQIVVQCAGIIGASRLVGKSGPHELDLFRRVLDVNLVGSFNVMRLAAQRMKDNSPNEAGERGVIINTASVSAFEGQIGQVAYSASKGGVASMTMPAARELAVHGIRVVAIAPGVFHTPMIDALPEKVQDSLRQQAVFPPRLGEPAEFALLVRQIVENPMLNGSVVRLDGAVRMAAK
jgi:3-hydroxyacyl-CoA dehydrogenase/3-hydroxy-2-methylbutyryl-CoA dehydrogenase